MRPKLMTIFLHTGWCRDFYCIIVIFFLICATNLGSIPQNCHAYIAIRGVFGICAAWNGYGKGGGGSRKLCDRKGRFRVRKIENWFSARLPHMGEKKKYKAHISKYV